MKLKPANHNILGELDLKNHFLEKLHELRYMKEEYYGPPNEKIDPLEVLAEAEAFRERHFIETSTQMPHAIGAPWQTDQQGEEQMVASKSIIDDEDTVGEEIVPPSEQPPTNSVISQYYSRQEMSSQGKEVV